MTDALLLAGMSFMDITPPLGVELGGYGFYRERKAELVRRALHAHALVLESGDMQAVLISAPLLGISAETTAQTRVLVERLTGIPGDNVLIACTHTHSGPATLFLRGCGERDHGYMAMLPRYLASTVKEAMEELQEVHVYSGQSTLTGLAVNRVDPLGAADAAVQALEFVNYETLNRYAVFSFGCHPVSTPPDDPEITEDFPGRAAWLLSSLADYDDALFLQGSCGDINPTVAHTDLGETERASRMLAGAALVAMAQAQEVENILPLQVVRKTIELPLSPLSPEELIRKRDDNRALLSEREADSEEAKRARFWVEACESLLMHTTGESDPWLEMLRDAQTEVQDRTKREPRLNELAVAMDLPPDAVARLLRLQQEHAATEYTPPQSVPCELQVLRMGDIVLLAHPTELFAEFGLEIKRRSPFLQTFVVGYANDFLGYIPNEAEFARHGYAAETVPFMLEMFPYVPNIGRLFTEACVQFLNDLHES